MMIIVLLIIENFVVIHRGWIKKVVCFIKSFLLVYTIISYQTIQQTETYQLCYGPPKRYKENTIFIYDLRSSSFKENIQFRREVSLIKEKFVKAGYPLRFINSVVDEFQKGKECGDERFIIPPSLFEKQNL